jgi:hypothetical protein
VAATVQAHGSQLLGMRLEEPSLDEVYTRYFREVHDAAA